MSEDKTIWEAAKGFVDRFGTAAPGEAAKRAEELRTAGDHDGESTWRQIASVAKELLSEEGPADGTVH